MTNERLLRPGVNFTTRGELKYARAVHLANELRGRIDEWAAAETLLARAHQVDEQTIEFRLVLRRQPPVEEWGLVLGDALHNFRGVLDNVVWALATLDGAIPARPTQVTFPLTATEPEWQKRTEALESIPADLLDRLRKMQPWVDGLAREEALFGVLHHLDITDKHRGLIASSLHLKRILISGFSLGEQLFDFEGEPTVSYETRHTPVMLQDDAILSVVRSSAHPLIVEKSYLARVDAQFAILHDESRLIMLDTFLGDLVEKTREWLDLIYGGAFHAQQMALARQSGESNTVYGYVDEDGQPHIVQLPMSSE